MKVLIAGGNGFIGSHLAEKLIERGDPVSLLDLNFNSNTKHLNCEKIHGDIKDYDSVAKTVNGKDVVFHLAAVSRVIWGQQDPVNCWRTNVLGTFNVLEACRKVENKPVIFYGSSREVYGEAHYLPVDEAHPKNPKSVYGMTKLCAEKLCHSYYDAFGQIVVILRFSNVYGSERDQLDRVIPKFILKALRGEDLTLYGGDQVLDFTFIDDTINGILKAFDRIIDNDCDILGEDFHFVTGRGVSVADLAEIVINLCDSSARIIKAECKSFDVRRFIGNPTKARIMIGYEPRVKLESGLRVLKERLSGIM